MTRHWSFVVCDPRYLYPVVAFLLGGGIGLAVWKGDPTHLSRVGNFVIGTGVWMSMRYTLREGIKRTRDANDSSPVLPGPGPAYAINAAYYNKLISAIGDAHLQIHGFGLVLAGSLVGSYGDWFLSALLPNIFK